MMLTAHVAWQILINQTPRYKRPWKGAHRQWDVWLPGVVFFVGSIVKSGSKWFASAYLLDEMGDNNPRQYKELRECRPTKGLFKTRWEAAAWIVQVSIETEDCILYCERGNYLSPLEALSRCGESATAKEAIEPTHPVG